MSVIAKAEVTISDIIDGNSISEITNFYKVSSKSSGETAPQTSGGRNLALSSKDFKESENHWSISSFYERSVDENGYTIMHGKRSGATELVRNRLIPHHYIYRQDMENGITVSFDFKCDKLEDMDHKCICALQIYNASGVRIGWFESAKIGDEKYIKLKNPYIDGEWNRAYVFFNKYNLIAFCTWDEVDYTSVSFQLVKNGSVYFRKVKIELGNKATDWTPAPEDLGWSTTVPTLTATNKYLWNYEMIAGSDGQVISYTEPRVIGVYGDKGNTGNTGATGNGIKSITEYYQISTSNTTAPTSWLTTVPTLTATNKYLWNYEKITYTNGTSVDTAKRVIGVYGDKGNTGATGPAGKGIKSTAITYKASTSGTTAPTGTWNTSVPSVPQGQYLWSRTVITYTDNSTSTTYSVAYIPKNGQNGATGSTGPTGPTGTGVASIVQQYYLSTSKTSQTGGSWVTSMPTWSSGKYLWTRYKIDYKNPASTSYTTPVCDSSWEAVNEVQVGGRNYILNSSYLKHIPNGTDNYDLTFKISDEFWLNADRLKTSNIRLSFYAKADTPLPSNFSSFIYIRSSPWPSSDKIFEYPANTTKSIRYEFYFDISQLDEGFISKEMFIRYMKKDTIPIIYENVKLEVGNVATDWTPAPEDVQADIDEAAKTATNYMNFDNNGLVIGDLTKGTLGRNVLIDSDSVDIRNGTNVLATFSDNIIELGKGNTNSSIELCDGAGTINVYRSLTGNDSLTLRTKDDISGLTLQSTIVTIEQPSRSPTDSTATISVYGDLPAPGLDTTSSYIQLKCRNGGGGSSFIGMYADKTEGVYDQSISLKVWTPNGGYSGIGITGTSVKINNGDLYDKYNKIFPNGVPVYGSGDGPDPNTTLDSLILSAHANAPGSGFKYIYTAFHNNKTTTSNRGQFAVPYGDSSNYVYYRYYYNGTWSVWFQLADQNDLNSAKSLAQRAANWFGNKHNERLSIEWAPNSSGMWTMYFYIDNQLVRTW